MPLSISCSGQALGNRTALRFPVTLSYFQVLHLRLAPHGGVFALFLQILGSTYSVKSHEDETADMQVRHHHQGGR